MPTGVYERHNQIDMTGQVIGYARVDGLAFRKPGQDSFWNCTCTYEGCGNKFIRSRHRLLAHKEDANCGCYSRMKGAERIRERCKNIGIRNLPQGKRLDEILHGMKQRCGNPNSKSYKDYGAKGVSICEEWLNNKKAFYDWALKNGYGECLTIDRINPNGNYEPSNCRWTTFIEQNNNQRNSKKYRFRDGEYTATEIARMVGISPSTMYMRLKKGMSIDEACSPINLQNGNPIRMEVS